MRGASPQAGRGARPVVTEPQGAWLGTTGPHGLAGHSRALDVLRATSEVPGGFEQRGDMSGLPPEGSHCPLSGLSGVQGVEGGRKGELS